MATTTITPRLPFDVMTELTHAASSLYSARLSAHEAGLHELAKTIGDMWRQVDGMVP